MKELEISNHEVKKLRNEFGREVYHSLKDDLKNEYELTRNYMKLNS